MKHLVKFNEAINRDSSKRTLNKSNHNYIQKFLSSKGIGWTYQDYKDYKDNDSDKQMAFLNRLKKSSDYFSIQFENVNVDSFIESFKKTFTNNIRVKGKHVIVNIESESDNDYISDYEDDINDSLLYFSDNDYSITKKVGSYSGIGVENNYQTSFKTAMEVNIIHNSEIEDDDSDYSDERWDIETLRRKEEFIIGKNLYKNTLSCVRRIQSFGLKVIVKFTRFEYFSLIILCKEDENFESTPII